MDLKSTPHVTLDDASNHTDSSGNPSGPMASAARAFPGNYNSLGEKSRISEQTRVERLFNFAQIFFLSLTFMSGWETMGLNLYSVFLNGGPEVLSWGLLPVIAGALAQSASLAEMSSIQPIAGAQYHWTYLFAPRRFRNFITWMQGWITWFAWISTLAGIANTTANMIQAIASLNYPDYDPKRWHITLIIAAMLMVEGLLNIYTFWIIPWIELLSGILHLTLFIVYSVILLVLAKRHDSEFVFFKFTAGENSGWTNNFIAWNIGLIAPTWGFVGFDAAVHLGEEVRRAKMAVPRVMFWTIAANGILAYAFSLIILYSMGPVDSVFSYQMPILQIFEFATGSKSAATAMGCGLLLISLSVNLACIASVSRLTWAWARDGALPRYFSIVSAKHRVPVRAIIMSSFFVVLLAVLNIPTYAAFGAIISLASLGLYTSYLIAILCRIGDRLSAQPVKLGEWNLGRYGMAINIFACIYTAYLMVWFPFPTFVPVTGEGMNYAGPIFGFVVLLALGLWAVWGRTRWLGPSEEIIELAIKEE